jgi:hypothetical protein
MSIPDKHIKALVDKAPAFTSEQICALRTLLDRDALEPVETAPVALETGARRVSGDVTDFPYLSNKVCYIVVRDGLPVQLRYRDGIRQAIQDASADKCALFAVWPGEWRSDLFRIDDLHAAARAFKVKL